MLAGAYARPVPPVVNARFTADTVLIGDQFSLQVEVKKNASQRVEFPHFENGYIVENVEILSESLDTLKREGTEMVLQKNYLLTVFDEGAYSLGTFPVLYLDKNTVDTIPSADTLFIVVNTIPVDTLTQTIADVRKPLDTPFVFAEIRDLFWLILASLLLIAALVYFIIRRRRKMPLFSRPKPADPPHVAAIKALEEVYSEKLWQNNKQKQYYTRVTDIIRIYIENRFCIHAMEKTSDEILRSFDEAALLSGSDRRKLSELFAVSDMVKFAKYIPTGEENEMSYNNAYYFVEETKQAEEEQPEKETM